jgi:8-oxo-dGTP diphosphatase
MTPHGESIVTNASRRAPVAAAGVVCLRGDDVLLVRRGAPPLENAWSLPGGRIEWGEPAARAALRELKEETGCVAELVGLVDVVDAVFTRRGGPDAEPWGHYVLIDYAARWVAGDPEAGDDAREARFFTPAQLARLDLWHETRRVIEAARKIV